MEKMAKFFGGLIILMAGVAGMVLVAPLFGAFVGWVLSLIVPGLMTHGLHALGFNVAPSDLPAVGAALAFLGGFFKFAGGQKPGSK